MGVGAGEPRGGICQRCPRAWLDRIEQAIVCLDAAHGYYSMHGGPQSLARATHNLAVAYQDRVEGDPVDNCQLAIDYYLATQSEDRRTNEPVDWATTEQNLGTAYLQRLRGDSDENIELAIACFQRALKGRTREELPFEWAITQANLATAFSAVSRVRRRKTNGPQYVSRKGLGGLPATTFPLLAWVRPRRSATPIQAAANGTLLLVRTGLRLQRPRSSMRHRWCRRPNGRLGEVRGLHVHSAFAMARIGALAEAAYTLERGRARGLGDILTRDGLTSLSSRAISRRCIASMRGRQRRSENSKPARSEPRQR